MPADKTITQVLNSMDDSSIITLLQSGALNLSNKTHTMLCAIDGECRGPYGISDVYVYTTFSTVQITLGLFLQLIRPSVINSLDAASKVTILNENKEAIHLVCTRLQYVKNCSGNIGFKAIHNAPRRVECSITEDKPAMFRTKLIDALNVREVMWDAAKAKHTQLFFDRRIEGAQSSQSLTPSSH